MFNPRKHPWPITCCAVLFVACCLLCGIASAAPSISLSNKSGPPTSRVLVSGRGFQANVIVDIYFDARDEKLVVSDGNGTFDHVEIHAPRSARPGEHWVTAREAKNNERARKPFLVQTNWSQFGFTPKGRRVNAYENVLSLGNVGTLELKWTYKTAGFVSSSPAVENDIAYIASDELYALDARTGAHRWKYPINSADSSPAVANGVVYLGSYSDNKLYALNASTGAKLWEYTVSGHVACPPTVVDGVVYFGSDDNNVYALNAASGALFWNYPTGGVIRSAPAVANGVVYVGSDDHNLYALDAGTGAELWSYTTNGEVFISSPAVDNGVVYVASCGVGNTVYALHANTGALLWSYATGDGIQASFAVANRVVYVASADGNVYALDASTGVKRWNYAAGVYTSSPAVANGVVYVGSYDDNVYALNASTGKILWSYNTGGSIEYASPTVANGIVYIGSDGGTIYAFGLPNAALDATGRSFETPRPEDTSARPQSQGDPAGSNTIRPRTLGLTGYLASRPLHVLTLAQ